jgi:hypothetical protein
MKQIRLFSAALGVCLIIAPASLRAQYAQQTLTFSLLGQYMYPTNILVISNRTSAGTTNTEFYGDQVVNTVLITTGNVIKALAVDEEGTNWVKWIDAYLVLRTSLLDSSQAIYLTMGSGRTFTNLNVSKYFNGSFSNNFTLDAPYFYGGLTNGFLVNMDATNYSGWSNPLYATTSTNHTTATNHSTVTVTNFGNSYNHAAAVLQYLSFSTTNLAFNLIGTSLAFAGNGNCWTATLVERVSGTNRIYQIEVPVQTTTAVGAFFFNTTSNLYGVVGTNIPAYFSGPVRGTFALSAPSVSTNALPP